MSTTMHGIRFGFLTAAAFVLAVQPASADVVHNDDVIVTGNICTGSTDCADNRVFNSDLEVSSLNPEIHFFDTSVGQDDWEIEADIDNLRMKNHVDGGPIVEVVTLSGGAPASSLFVSPTGDIGLGTSVPAEELHIRRPSGAGSVRILTDSTDNGPVQWVMRTNSANRRFLAQDEAGNNQSQILFENAGTVKFLGPTAAIPLMTVSPSGLSLPAGAFCGANGAAPAANGCDAVFTPHHPIESIEEHAAYMWENSHLPAIGPVPDGETVEFNVHQKYFALLHELEKAHIYIERLNEQAKNQKAEQTAALAEKDRRLAATEERLARLEALLSARPGAED